MIREIPRWRRVLGLPKLWREYGRAGVPWWLRVRLMRVVLVHHTACACAPACAWLRSNEPWRKS